MRRTDRSRRIGIPCQAEEGTADFHAVGRHIHIGSEDQARAVAAIE